MDFKLLIAESAIADLKEIVEFVAQDDADTFFTKRNPPWRRSPNSNSRQTSRWNSCMRWCEIAPDRDPLRSFAHACRAEVRSLPAAF